MGFFSRTVFLPVPVLVLAERWCCSPWTIIIASTDAGAPVRLIDCAGTRARA
jgi:hypothetical protein